MAKIESKRRTSEVKQKSILTRYKEPQDLRLFVVLNFTYTAYRN